MTNSQLFNLIYRLILNSKSLSCPSLKFTLTDNSGGVLLSLLDKDRNSLSSTPLNISLLEANSYLESLEYANNPFGTPATKSILIRTGINNLCHLQKLTHNIQNGKIEFDVKEYISEQGLGKELGLTDSLINLLDTSTTCDSGLIVCNGKQVESKLILQTLYPHWPHLSHDEFRNNTGIDKAFIYLQDCDPIALVTRMLEICTDKEVRKSVAERIKCVISLIPVKKQCGACAKPTPIPPASRNHFPLFLVEQVPTSYLFSRGCQRCEYRSYKGLTFLESFFANRGGFLREQSMDLNPEAIFEKAREMGLCIFHESGLEKIKSGITSLEQISEHTPPLDQAFSELLNSCKIDLKKNVPPQTNLQRNILIVEDDTDQREILQLVFSKEGFNVFTADNGKSALEVLKINTVQIVLSDIMMPVMNGLQLVRFLKANDDYKHIPVLMLTASSNPDHEVKLLEEGADDYCAKNVKKKVLLTRVEKLMEKFKGPNSSLSHFLT